MLLWGKGRQRRRQLPRRRHQYLFRRPHPFCKLRRHPYQTCRRCSKLRHRHPRRYPHRTCRRPHRFSKPRYPHQRQHPHRHQCLSPLHRRCRHPHRRWRRCCTRRRLRYSVPPALRSTRRVHLRTRRPGRIPQAARAMRSMAPPGWGWDQHSFYPTEASQTNEGGNVKVHIVIAPDGRVTSIEVVQSSGLSVLDAAAVAVFRNAHLPPFPPGTPAQPADVVVTLHYRPG